MPSSMSMEQVKEALRQLIQTYHALRKPEVQSEANVRANFIDPLFEILGWPIRDPVYYDREQYLRGTGYADIALKADPQAEAPLIFIEAKRFGVIELLSRVQDRHDKSILRQRLRLPGMSVDRTREEQQAINYAYQNEITWAILTNFERLRLFNARRDTLVLSFDSPGDLLERFEELWQLAFSEVQKGSLAALRSHRERRDIDEEYLRLINEWRLRLGQDIISHRENRILLTDPETDQIDVYKLRDVVQRILDRLVVIRYAEDRLVIRADQLRAMLEFRERTDYSVPLLDQMRYFVQIFNVRHNGTLFADHLCDRMTVSADVLHAIILNLYDARFRAMSADIMGNTYEQYLGQTLHITDHQVQTVDNLETRKAQGSYYTPEFVVRYIVNQTLGRYLYGTDNGRPDGVPLPGHSRKRLDDIDGSQGDAPLTILDLACGSGSFLMHAYHVLEEFYASEIVRLTQEREAHFEQLVADEAAPMEIQIALVKHKQRLDNLKDYKNKILERHLYGVDLDSQAAELAAVNLMLRALTRDARLPLILNQNVKVGNSFLSGAPLRGESARLAYAPYALQLAELRRLRLAQQGVIKDDEHPIELQAAFERLAAEVSAGLNHDLSTYYGQQVAHKHPFNWAVEFPEVFVDAEGQLKEDGGFTFIIGNPPYLSVDDTWGQNSPDAAYLKDAFSDLWSGKSDVYYYFIRRALMLLQSHGHLGFITARYYLEAYYARNLRKIMLAEAVIRQIIDFGDCTIFPGVGTKTCITLLRRETDARVRDQNQLLFDRVPHKAVDAEHFLDTFRATAHSFEQAALDDDSWNLYGGTVAKLIQKIDTETIPLGNLAFVGQGMQTGCNAVFVVDQATLDHYQIEPDLVRKNIKNQDITPYNLGFRGLYLIYPEDLDTLAKYPHTKAYLEAHRETLEARAAFKRGDCEWWHFTWPLHKERYHASKIVTPFIAPENRFALDARAEYIGLTDTYAIFETETSPDLRYLLALLNSDLLNVRFRYIGKAKDYRYEYVENGLVKIPIRLADEAVMNALIILAQRMLDLHFVRQTLLDEFTMALEATPYTKRDFYGAYYRHSEYREHSIHREGRAEANARGTVVGITVAEREAQLLLSVTEEENGEMPLIAFEIPDAAFRRFLLLATRAELFDKRRKKIWSRGRMLEGVLKALHLPVLSAISAEANLQQIHDLMAEVQRRVTRSVHDLPDPEPPATRMEFDTLLALGNLEDEIAVTERQINELVYDIYGLDSDNRRFIEAQK